MKAKQNKSKKEMKASDKALLDKAASKLAGEVLFREKVEKAKLYLRRSVFSTQK